MLKQIIVCIKEQSTKNDEKQFHKPAISEFLYKEKEFQWYAWKGSTTCVSSSKLSCDRRYLPIKEKGTARVRQQRWKNASRAEIPNAFDW